MHYGLTKVCTLHQVSLLQLPSRNACWTTTLYLQLAANIRAGGITKIGTSFPLQFYELSAAHLHERGKRGKKETFCYVRI